MDSTTRKLIELAKNNFYGMKKGGEITDLMRQNLDLTIEKLKEFGIQVIFPRLWSSFDERWMEPLSVEYLPEVTWWGEEVVVDVISLGFFDITMNRLIEPAKVKVGAGTCELNWKFLLNYGNIPGMEYNPVLVKSSRALFGLFKAEDIESVKRTMEKLIEEFLESGYIKEYGIASNYLKSITNEEVMVKLTDMFARYFRGSILDRNEIEKRGPAPELMWESIKINAEKKELTIEEVLKLDVLDGWELIALCVLPAAVEEMGNKTTGSF